jgi:hypothetical protein
MEICERILHVEWMLSIIDPIDTFTQVIYDFEPKRLSSQIIHRRHVFVGFTDERETPTVDELFILSFIYKPVLVR